MFPISRSFFALGALGLGLIASPNFDYIGPKGSMDDDESDGRRAVWEISVTNLTRGQIFSSPVVAVHSKWMQPLWELGQPASIELTGVAEDAANQPLIEALMATGQASDVQVIAGAAGPIMPGETASVRVRGNGRRFNRLSMAGMLVITNDAFFGLNSVQLPRRYRSSRLFSPAYDAGSEANNESCAFIPGPPCNNPGMRIVDGSEGYVHIHAGIHGIGDLSAAIYDWRDKVAVVRIRRVR